MSILINGMEMPKQTEVQTDKGTLKLWTIRNWKVGQDIEFGAAEIPCDLSFNHDGTIHLSVLGRKYSLTDVPAPHGELIDRDVLLRDHVHKDDMMAYCDNFVYETAIEDMPTIIKAEE